MPIRDSFRVFGVTGQPGRHVLGFEGGAECCKVEPIHGGVGPDRDGPGVPPLLMPGATATGTAFAMRGAAIAELAGGRIRRSADYYDLLTIVRQLEEASAAGTPTAGTPSP